MPIISSILPENIRPHGSDEVKVIECGNVIELQYSQHHSIGAQVVKLDKNYYLDLRTGEVKEFVHNERRVDDTKSLKVTFEHARRIINANIVDTSRCRFITLTYAENMQDTKKLYYDFKNFWKRKIIPLYPGAEYINAIEPQRRGAWHIHMLLIFPDVAPFIPNAQLAEMWGHGFVSVRALDNVDNVGAYLTGYLANIPLDEYDSKLSIREDDIKCVDVLDDNGVLVPKKVVKGARLPLYPSGMQPFRYSKGIIKPEPYYTTADRAEQLVRECALCRETTRQIIDTESDFTNTINYRQYNRKRKETL